MPPLLKTYFNPSHRSFLQTLFTATFLGSVLIVAFPCPVRPIEGGFHKVVNQDGDEGGSAQGSNSKSMKLENKDGRIEGRGKKVDVVVMLNERGRSRGGRALFMEED
ncbi:hypothetical protein HD553DRAFT_345024 [Filobasidium floriforme]|uniref:uncharacterized protein n=1 Tax=Filobasidium floriforme TaxID=5210 RepID=UPI001E8DA456|nr:uncharacterized protein HD553DRAFT_345024 [Filobasidium floriforme]KAH8080113.1 hypothetical protein HD553DRAFT_345024 [Filobasidium floriforme]